MKMRSHFLNLHMSVKVKRHEKEALFFVTFTCYKWLPLFEKTSLYDNIYKWFTYMELQGIKTAGYVLLPNHIHCMIYLPTDSKDLDIVIGNCKRFLTYEIIKRLKEQKDVETLELLEKYVTYRENKNGKIHNVFQPSFDAQLCLSEKFTLIKLKYMHLNPLSGKWKLAEGFLEYEHSSARY
ncbi:MAG: REP element-mobilizing transposase RayT [Arcticibacterium sp.]|jgi:REP element-mobilizing transposase RayT